MSEYVWGIFYFFWVWTLTPSEQGGQGHRGQGGQGQGEGSSSISRTFLELRSSLYPLPHHLHHGNHEIDETVDDNSDNGAKIHGVPIATVNGLLLCQ